MSSPNSYSQIPSPTDDYVHTFNFDFKLDFERFASLTQDLLLKTADPDDLKIYQKHCEENCRYEGFEETLTFGPIILPPISTSCHSSCKSEDRISLRDVTEPKELLGKREFDQADDFTSISDLDENFLEETQKRRRSDLPRRTTRSSRNPARRYSESSVESEVSRKPKELYSKSAQNIMKNHQGTLCGKIKKECELLVLGLDTPLFGDVTELLREEKREEFREFALNYDKKHKTWETLIGYFESEPWCGILFIKMILRFLSTDFRGDYERSIDRSLQMKQETKVLLKQQSNKEFYWKKFESILNKMQGDVDDFEEEIKKSRKNLKLL